MGDYTRRLAGELIRQGHPSVIIALNDSYISKMTFEMQEIESASISVLRLPGMASWTKRILEARNMLQVFQPDWISLQFVTFGFHRKGLGFGLGGKLAALGAKTSWHIMFHELWLGLDEKPPMKQRVWGMLQRTIIRDMVRRLRPQIVSTQADPYCEILNREKIAASVLPLIGNVPYVPSDGWAGLVEPLLAEAVGHHLDRTKFYLAGIFGAVHPEWSAKQVVDILSPSVRRSQKRLVLVFLGRSNLTPASLNKLKSTFRGHVEVIATGEKTPLEISRILQCLDLGLATSPRHIIQKSGSVAAMLEHGLQVLVTRDDWRLRGAVPRTGEDSLGLLSPSQFALLPTLPARNPQRLEDNGVKKMARQMLLMMESPFSTDKPDLSGCRQY